MPTIVAPDGAESGSIRVLPALLWTLCLVTLISVFVPLSPLMPATGLDGSWMIAMNQAVAQSSVFGRDMIFTFGPYASVYTRSYHPATDPMMLAACLYLALSSWACLIILVRQTGWRLPFLFCLVLAGAVRSRDAVLLSYQLLAAVTIFMAWGERQDAREKMSPLVLAIILGPFGLLPLVKGSMLILCGAISLLCCLYFLLRKNPFAALMSVVPPSFSMAVFWIAAGQPIGALPAYFSSMSQIIGGYTEAMMSVVEPAQIVFYLLVSAFLLFGIAVQKKIPGREQVFLLLLYFLFLFLSFKAGFVRADHQPLAGEAILLAGLFLPYVLRNKATWALALLACCDWLYLAPQDASSTLKNVPANLEITYLDAIQGIHDRTVGTAPEIRFSSSLRALRQRVSFPAMSGPTDIYPYDQLYLFAAGLEWQSRPVLQSYSAYTPALSEANRQHLLGAQAPDNIIFKVKSIDQRIPSIDDGASWPLLLARYQIFARDNGYMFLKKIASNATRASDTNLIPIGQARHALGEKFSLPVSKDPLFVQIEIAPTLLGKIAAILYKPLPLQMELALEDGSTRQYSVASGMMKSGFLLSPLIEKNEEFAALYGDNNSTGKKTVKTFSLVSGEHGDLFWKTDYHIVFNSIPTTFKS